MDCFESLLQEIAKGEGPVFDCVGECVALHMTLVGVQDPEILYLEEDEDYQNLPTMPGDNNFSAWYHNGPFRNLSVRPLDLFTPSGFDHWAPIPKLLRERERQEYEAMRRSRTSDHAALESWQSTSDDVTEFEKRYHDRVSDSAQSVAENAVFTKLTQWFKQFSVGERVENEDKPDDAVIASSLPAVSLNREDGATLHIGLSPFEDRLGPIACHLVTINAYIKLPGVVAPVGDISGYAVQRGSGWWDPRQFHCCCDAVSEEFINAILTFCTRLVFCTRINPFHA